MWIQINELLREKCLYPEFFWCNCGKIKTVKTPNMENLLRSDKKTDHQVNFTDSWSK